VKTASVIFPTGGGSTTISQGFSYDGLNRLWVAAENPASLTAPACPDASSSWCQQNAYDGYGNWTVPQSSGLGASLAPTSYDTNNRMIGWTYDLAGNVLAQPGPSSFLYDGENRQIVRPLRPARWQARR
jgi:predicted acyl esterase